MQLDSLRFVLAVGTAAILLGSCASASSTMPQGVRPGVIHRATTSGCGPNAVQACQVALASNRWRLLTGN
jgi:hypothetical protein